MTELIGSRVKEPTNELTAEDGAMGMPVNTLCKHTVKVGFIGLGLMGSRLTRRLHSSGWNVQAWNRSPEASRAMSREGVRIAESVVELVADSDIVLSCLANDAAVHSVYCDAAGVLSAAKPGTILLEMSTISPRLSHLLHEELPTRARGSSTWLSPDRRRQSRPERSHCLQAGTGIPSSNALPFTSPLPSSGS